MLFRSAWVAFDPDEIGTRSRTVSGVVVMGASSSTGSGDSPGGHRAVVDRAAADHLPEPLLGGFLLARARVRGVHDQRDSDEPHEAARVVVVSPARLSGARPRWSRSVVPV